MVKDTKKKPKIESKVDSATAKKSEQKWKKASPDKKKRSEVNIGSKEQTLESAWKKASPIKGKRSGMNIGSKKQKSESGWKKASPDKGKRSEVNIGSRDLRQKLDLGVRQNSESDINELNDMVFTAPDFVNSEQIGAEQEVSSILELIRTEIIEKQQDLLREIFGEKMSREEFLHLASSDSGLEVITSMMGNETLKHDLESIELAGYKKLNENFRDNFRTLDWQNEEDGVRQSDILNSKGEKTCSITEKTIHNSPQNITLSDGSTQMINSYRQIEFPKELELNTGPVDFSIAMKDANGKNMPKDQAVYFTAHYDKTGKLQEVSSPLPVKFSGKGDEAVGYIERDGQVYSLPVNQGQYKQMMQEVGKNKGMALDFSKVVETPQLSTDQVISKKDEQGQEQSVSKKNTQEVEGASSLRKKSTESSLIQEEVEKRVTKMRKNLTDSASKNPTSNHVPTTSGKLKQQSKQESQGQGR